MKSDYQDNLSQNYKFELAEEKCSEARDILEKMSGTKDKVLLASAINLYSEAIELNPEMIEAYLALAYLSIYLDETEKSFSFLYKVLELEPFNLSARKMLKEIKSENNPNDSQAEITQQTEHNEMINDNETYVKEDKKTNLSSDKAYELKIFND